VGQPDEVKLAYRLRRGGPETIVFIPGLGASKSSYETCFGLASYKDYTLAAVDLPGYGQSNPPDNFSYSMKDQADLILKWIRDLGIAPIILVGHSMGGVIGLYLAEALGPRVKNFISLEGNLSREDCFFSGKTAALSQEAFQKQGLQQFERHLREMVARDPSPGLIRYCENISEASPQALYLSSVSLLRESSQGNLKKRFLNISAKSRYVFGERSVNQSTKTFLDAHGIPYFIVPESGHFMMDDQPNLFYRMLFDALGDKG